MARFSVYVTEEWQRRVDVYAESNEGAVKKAEELLGSSAGAPEEQAWMELIQMEKAEAEQWSEDDQGPWAGKEDADVEDVGSDQA